ADERDRVQKKTFTKWVNKHLIKVRKHITDLYEDLRDGHNLISLLEVLSGVTLPREKGRMRFHRLQNVQIALDFLKQRQVKLVNIRNDDITDGNPKLTLGLIWTIILHFQISEIYVSGESSDLTAKEKLLLWSQQATEGYPGLRCVNFTSSWSNGRMFNALLHRYRPDLIDMEAVSRQSNRENLEQAFEIAESLGVTSLLDAEDVDVPSPDEKSVITYVSSIYDAFPKIPEGGEGISAQIRSVKRPWQNTHPGFPLCPCGTGQINPRWARKSSPKNARELKALYNEYIHFKETEIPAKEAEKGHIEHLYKLLQVWIEFGRIKLPQGLHPNDLEEDWGKLILEMLDREKALRPAVERLELLLQRANKIQNMALDCEEKLTLAKNTLQADMSRAESGEAVQCERELACYLQDCQSLIQQLNQELKVLRDEKYYQVEQLMFRVSCLQEELVSLRLQCSSVYRKGHFSQALGTTVVDHPGQRATEGGLTLGQTLLGAVGAVGAALLRRPAARSQLVAMSSSEDEGSLRFIYELLGWVEETQDLLERAEWGADLPSVENNLHEHNAVHGAVEELMSSLQEARAYEAKVSPNFKSSYCETLAKLEHQYCKLLEHSSWRLRSLESLHAFVAHCTEELIWLNEREEEEIAFDWSDNNPGMNAKRELYSEMRLELDEKRDVMRSLQETANRLCQENHPAKQTVEAYSAALQTQWQWVNQLCMCVEQHLKDNTAYFQFMGDARDCESYLRQLQETIKRQYTCDRNSRLSKLEDLLQDSMEEKEQLIEYRSTVASLVGRAKAVVQLRPRGAESTLGATTPIRAICDYRQIEITITRGEECVLEENCQRTKWKVISTTGNEAMVPSVCFTVPPPNQEAIDTASRAEQLYQKVMSLWHQLHVNMKSVVSWHYLLKDIRTVSGWTLDTVRSQAPAERQQILDHLDSQLADFLSDSKESAVFTAGERRELEQDVQQAQQHCQDLLLNMETVEKDESVSRSYLSELQNISLHLDESEQRLIRAIQTPPPSRLLGDGVDDTPQIAEQEELQSDLDAVRSSLGDVSRRCVSFFEEKPTSSAVPVLRSELNQVVEKTDKLHNLSTVYLEKLRTVDVLMRSLDEAESQVRKNESRLSEDDTVPADAAAIQSLRDQLGRWQAELVEHDGVFQALQSEVDRAKEAGFQLSRLHPDRSSELERYQERANQMADRWSGVKRQMETRRTDLEALCSALQQYRHGHSALISWIEETTERQENTRPGQTDSKALSEQLAQQTALVAEIEQNQAKLDECQTHSKLYCTSVKDYELQLMTYRAFVESTHKSSVKRRRIHSSSDSITQEFMDLRTRYTALVTLTTQHVKYISDALRRLEEEEKEVEEEKQARVGQVSDLLGWVKGLQGRTGGPDAESSLAAQQAVSEQLAAKKDEVAEAIRSAQVFLLSKQANKLSSEERAHVEAQLDELKATYKQLCNSSAQQLQQLEQQLAKEEERKNQTAIAGVIDLGTVETFPVFKAAQRGLIDQDTCHVLLEAQLIMGGLLQPDSTLSLSLEQGLAEGLIDAHTGQCLSELERAWLLVENTKCTDDQQQNVLPVTAAMESGVIREEVGLRILELQMHTGGLRSSKGRIMSLEQADDKRLLSPGAFTKLQSRQQQKELIDPNTAETLNLHGLLERCVLDNDSGLLLLPVKQQPGGTVCLQSGRKVGIFRAIQEGLIDRKVTVRLLEAQLFAGGIADPRSGHRLTVHEAVRHGLMDQDLACATLARQLQDGGILDPVSGERLDLEESIRRDLLSPRLALLVLESLGAFMGLLWPESGELLPFAEALQQGSISGELSKNTLRQRHVIEALYNPETLQVLPLNQAAEEALEPSVVSFLKSTHIPDVLSSINQSVTPSPNRLSWGSASSSPPPSSPLHSSSPAGLVCDATPTYGMDPEEQAKDKLLFHLMTHSYVDAHSGKRLVLLDSELVELVKATERIAKASKSQIEPESSLTKDERLRRVGEFSLADIAISETQTMVEKESSDITPSKEQRNSTGSLGERYDRESEKKVVQSSVTTDRDLAFEAINESTVAKDVKEKAKNLEGPNEVVATKFKPRPDGGQEGAISTITSEETKTPKSKALGANVTEDVKSNKQTKQQMLNTETDSEHASLHTDICDSGVEKKGEDTELAKLVRELQRGGLMTEEGEKLLPDEAVAQGVIPGHTAVKLMAQTGLFGGFLDARSGESLSMEDVGLDEELMWSVLKADKMLAGVVDAEKKQICGVRQAAQAGLIDPDTAARLLEAQVASGGIVDLGRDEKVSVTLAATLGLIEEDQREELVALEKAYKGKNTDLATALTKASLQLQMDGFIDPESKSPVPLEEAIQKGLIRSEEAYQVLARQVAEGGIIHHASGMRLSVPDAVDRGLVDRSIAPGLEELEWVYQGKISSSSHPKAVVFQASTGAILDPDSGSKLTLTEAVARRLLDENIARDAMASSTVRGVLDPESARIVPYSDLVNRGKIDIGTGKRFLEVKPFRGVRDGQTRNLLTLPEAIASKQVDPVPALRLLQSQADSGGIIDISTGERLPLPEACERGLVEDNMARVISTNQLLKGGLVDPATGQRVSNLEDAVAKKLISRDVASEIQEKLASLEFEGGEGGAVASAIGTYGPAVKMKDIDSYNTDSKRGNNCKRVQEAIEQIVPQTNIRKSEPPLKQKPDERVQVAVSETENERKRNLFRGVLGESIQTYVGDVDTDLQGEVRIEAAALKLGEEPVEVGEKECRASDESKSVVQYDSEDGNQAGFVEAELSDDRERKAGIEEDYEKSDLATQSDDVEDNKGNRMEGDEPVKIETKPSKDAEQSDQLLTSPSKETESKSKKKRKNKKNGKHKGPEREKHFAEMKPSQIDQADANIEGQPAVHQCKYITGETTGIPEKDVIEPEEEMEQEQKEKVEEAQRPKQQECSQALTEREEQEFPLKSALPNDEKAALILKARESILKKVFEKGVSEKQAAEELQALRKEVGKERRGEAFKEDMESQVASNEKDRSFGKEGVGMAPSRQPKESDQSRQRKKNKKGKSLKVADKTQPHTEELTTEKVDSDTKAAMAKPGLENPTSPKMQETDKQPARDIERPSVVEGETFLINVDVDESGQQSLPHLRQSDEPHSHTEEHVQLAADIQPTAQSIPTGTQADKTAGKALFFPKSSLLRQECLERDQRLVALLSMVRHVEVQLKQQHQQSVGRSLIALDDIIRQTETLDLELRDLQPVVTEEVEAAEELLKPHPKDVPPQLLLAVEKDGRSLARGYEAATALSQGILQSLRDHRDSYKEAVTAELKSLGGQVESLLSWLRETEAQMNGGMEKMEEAEKDDHCDQLTQQLNLCKELQFALTARSGEVNGAAFDVQVFISERAQDMAPEQSRQLLGQLQQLQSAFHLASGQAQAWADALSANLFALLFQIATEVVQQQKAECSQKLEGLTVWLAGAASLLASQKAGAESCDVNTLQEKQKRLKEAQKDLQTKEEGISETIRSVEELLADRGENLSPEERHSLQGALTRLKEQYSALKDSATATLSEVDTAINTTVQQNTQRAKAVEDLQETKGQIDTLLKDLSSINQPGGTGVGSGVTQDVTAAPFSQPEGALMSHTEALQTLKCLKTLQSPCPPFQAELQQLQSQQAQLHQIAQSTRSLLDQPDSAVPPEEKQRLRAALDQLQAQHQDRLQSCQDRLRKSEALKDELMKFLQEHGSLGAWLEQNEQELLSLAEGETDAQGLKGRLEEHRKLAEDVICHKADLRFVSISGQKVLDSLQGALEQVGSSDPALDSTKLLVTDKLQDANHRYTTLHTKSTELGGRLSGLLERYQQYQDEVVSVHSWLSAQEQNQSKAKPSGETDPQNLQDTLRQVQLLQDELAERSVQLEKVKRAGRDLVSTDESPSLKAVDILCAADGLEKRFGSLSASVSERAEQLQTAVAQSVSVQEGLKGLLSWLEKLVLNPAPVEPTAQAVQDALTQNQKLRQELLSRQGSVEATRESISKLLQSSDASTASGLQGALDDLTERYAAAQATQAEREAELRGLLPRLEGYERLGIDLRAFTQSRHKALSPAGQPDRSVDDYRQTIEEVRSELEQEAGQLKSFCNLGTELSQSKAFNSTRTLLDNVKGVSDEFTQLEANVNKRFAAIQACEQQLLQFRGLSGSLSRWLQTAQDQLPSKEANLNTEGLQRRVQQLTDLMNDWESQRSRVQELNKTGSELESLIIDVTAPQTKAGAPHINGSSGPSSVNGIHTCKDLTELQLAVSDVNGRYETLGGELKERLGRQTTSLEQRQKASQGADELKSWLTDREHSLTQGQAASPSKPEAVRAQAEENKALLSQLAEHSGKVEALKSTLRKLIADNPDSPEADTWRQQLQEIDSRWQTANQAAAERQTELEACADRLGSFASAAAQLGPWLREKELMMSVLGPLSIDPNMLNTQRQQAQFMLREFETRRPQFDQLTQSAEGILSQTGDSAQDPEDLAEVRSELGSITQQWEDLTNRLTQRSKHIDQAQGTSGRYQDLLRELSSSVSALAERLDGQASLSAQPEALKRRLQETGEIRSELERRRTELAEAERLCGELSAIVAEPYLKEELSKRLESVSGPLKNLEERAADGLSQLQAALSSTQQFQQMFEELRSWLDKRADPGESPADPLPCQPAAVHSLLAHTDELQRAVASQRGSYELIQAEGASLLATLPAGGDERSALQSRLASLKRDWEGLNQGMSEREARLKNALGRAEAYQQHRAELMPWLAECDQRDGEIQPALDSAALDDALQKARGLALDLERRQPLLEAFNTAADQLLEQCCIGEEEVRDEKAQLNGRVDGLADRLHNRTSQLEELAGRLKEFEEGRQAAERRLEAAKHQIEVQEALGPQACSSKSLERLRSQQEGLRSLKPQVVYLRDLAQGLVQDAPQTLGGSSDGAQRLQEQARGTEKEYDDVTDKIEQCCSSLESRLQGVGEVQSNVRDVFSRIADLDDELDSFSPVGRDADSLASQADSLKGFLLRLSDLRAELEGHTTECTTMLRREGSSPDLLALRRESEALSRQAGKLSERGQARLDQIEDAAERVREFYRLVALLQGLLGRAEDGLNAQGMVGTEVETIKQQLQEFKAVEREQVDGIQPKLQHINAVGQGLIQSAAKHTDTQALEHDLETTNLRWNSLNKRVAERIAQLQEALLHCGKFQDALEPLLSWLSDTEELVANQKPPSAEYRVVKAQIQEQKLLQRLLDDRRPTVEMIRAEGERIAATADTADREKIGTQLHSLAERWTDLLDKAAGRQRQLEELQVLALHFHEALEPLGEWLSATERRLSSAEPMGTQTAKISQQITKHKSLNEEIVSRKKTVDQAIKNGQALLKQTTGEEVLLIQEKLDGIKSRYGEMTAGSSKALRTLEQALQLATRFASAHDDINQWLDAVEAELHNVEPDATPAYQDRQKELKKVSAEKRLVLDTVNEVGSALLDLVPWRAREGLDRLVADANQRYRQSDENITQRVQLVQAIQRSQQYEEAVDAEMAWVGETERKLASLGPLSLEPDVTVAQMQVQRAFNIDIIRHKDTVDQLLGTRDDILETCSDAQKDVLIVKTDSLSARYEAVSQSHSERFSALEQAQVLVARFWETYEELEPWLGETEALITQLPPPAIDTDALRLQQDQMRLLRESIAEHKPHIDKLLKIGPQLAELSLQEGAAVTQRYAEAERRYLAIKEGVKGRATTLDEAVSQSAQFHDKMDPLLETLEGAAQRLRQPPPVAAEVEKIREQLAEHRAQGLELDKLLPSFSALCARGEELIRRAAHNDPAAQAVRTRLLRLRSLWDEIRQRAEEREGKLNDIFDLAGKFWADVAALLSTLRDSQDIVKELEDPGVDPSLIKQQIEAAEAIKAETDGLREELEFVRTLGADLIFACGETEKPEVKKTIDEMNAAWEGLNRTWRERMERLEEAMTASVQYQDALQSMFDYLDNAVIKLCEMSTVGTDLGTVKQQIEELKQYKVEVYQQQIDMEKLCHQGELLLKKVSDQTDRDMIQEPLIELRHLWENLGDKITQRQHKLEAALLALGQFQHALSELQAWLNHTHTTLDTQRPVSSDPKAIEIELAKHHVLRNDVLSHHATVENVSGAGTELLESSPGDEASHLRDQLDHLNQGWESLLLKTQERQKLLEGALQQAEGFHGELEEFLQWLRRTDSQLSAAKPTGGLPETAREQLEQHLELHAQLAQRADQYHRLLDQGESMLLARGGEDAGPGTTQTQQNLAMLQNKWASFNTKMDDRRAKLEEAVSLATGFQTSLQDTINWLTQAEQTLNMAQSPSLILDTVLFQIDEHKVFVNEVNTHREQVLALEKAGSHLRFASLKQDVVLIKNLLLSVQARWDKLVQRSLDRGRHLDEARKRAKQFHEAWRKLTDWLEEAEKRLDSELEISNEPDKIKVQLAKHKEFQKALGSKQPVYDTTVRSGRAMRDKAQLPTDTQKLDHLVGEVRDKWDTVCGKSVERQHKLEEALLFSGQFAEALQALVDWLYRVEPQLTEDLPVHGDLDLVSNLMDSHKAFQKELGKRTSSVQALKRSARELMDTGRDDTAWVKVQVQELSNRWDTVCALSVTKQTRLQQALKQAEEFRTAIQFLLEWLSEAEQTLRFRGVLPEEAETLQALLHTHRDFMGTVEEKRTDVNKAAGMGEGILTVCHADSITTIKHWITIIRARFEEVLTWAKQHEQRLETALTEVLNNANLLEELLSWLQFAETTLVQKDTEPLPQDIAQLKALITEHQMFMEEMTRKQPDVDKVTKTYKRKPAEAPSSLAERRGARESRKQQQQQQAAVQLSGGNPRLNQLCARWQQVWLLALDRQRKLNDGLDRLEELKEFANFDFDVWRKKYMRWMNHKKSRVMDFFRRIDKDQDGKITRQEFIDGILASKFPTSRLEMTAVADIFDRDGDGYIDYYEFVAALHPNKDAYRPTTDADKIEDEVTRQVAQCKCAKRFQVEQIGENKYRFFLGNQFGDSQQLRLVRILRSTVMVRVGGGWMALDEFLVKNDPCRARGRTNLELREKFILPEGTSQGLATFRSRGRRSKPGSRNASPTRSSSSASHSGASLPSAPSTPATPTASASSRGAPSGSKLKRPTFHSSRGSLTGENGGTPHSSKPARAGTKIVRDLLRKLLAWLKRDGALTLDRLPTRSQTRGLGSDASEASELQDSHSVCSDASDTPRRPGAKPSKIPTISKKAPSPKNPGTTK
uniref:Microtubule actin crosslinking factor 1 n=1 Tax=Gasterosteus aculeatus TaxID=69293 RepID=G3NBA0_GASAC